MKRNAAIKINTLVGQIVMAARELVHGSRHGAKTTIAEIDANRAEIGDLLVKEIEDSFKPQLFIAAYLPAGDKHPVLQVCIDDHGSKLPVSVVYRREDPHYSTLLNACCGSPIWLYDCKPLPLI